MNTLSTALEGDAVELCRRIAEQTSDKAIQPLASMSAAISLKRIADALTGVGPNILSQPINSYGETIGDAIQGQMIRGQRGIDQYEGR